MINVQCSCFCLYSHGKPFLSPCNLWTPISSIDDHIRLVPSPGIKILVYSTKGENQLMTKHQIKGTTLSWVHSRKDIFNFTAHKILLVAFIMVIVNLVSLTVCWLVFLCGGHFSEFYGGHLDTPSFMDIRKDRESAVERKLGSTVEATY